MSANSFIAQGQIIKFGQWQIDLRTDEFADISFRGHPILRSIRAVVRDRDWNTAELQIDDRSLVGAHETGNSYSPVGGADQAEPNKCVGSVTLKLHSVGLGSTFSGTLTGNFLQNTAEFVLTLTSDDSFQTNRTGLIVLHEPEVAGLTLQVRHSDGSFEKTLFPKAISPNQPVFDITALQWKQGTKDAPVTVDMQFAGDVFEMEDQRNWTDASYKTYSRPLAKPFPYLVKRHETITQKITIKVETESNFEAPNADAPIQLFDTGNAPTLQIGASTAPGDRPAFNEFAAAELVEIDLSSSNWKAALNRSLASSLSLDIRVIYSEENASQLDELVSSLDPKRVLRIACFDSRQHVSTTQTQSSLLAALAKANKKIATVSGARSHFTELNREQDQILPQAEAICFSSTPLFHSLTAAQLLESVAIQRLTAAQAVQIAASRPVHVGPITLRPRFNNVATGAQPGPNGKDLSQGYGAEFTGGNDDRQASEELAAWVVASAAAFMVRGIESITWFEAWGPRGIRDTGGVEYPVSSALRALAEISGKPAWVGHDAAGAIWVIASKSSSGDVVLAANLSSKKQHFKIDFENKTTELQLAPLSWVRLENRLVSLFV